MKEKIALISVLANIFLAGGKIFAGFISHSNAVLAEGIHSLMDVFLQLLVILELKYLKSQKIKNTPMAIGNLKF